MRRRETPDAAWLEARLRNSNELRPKELEEYLQEDHDHLVAREVCTRLLRGRLDEATAKRALLFARRVGGVTDVDVLRRYVRRRGPVVQEVAFSVAYVMGDEGARFFVALLDEGARGEFRWWLIAQLAAMPVEPGTELLREIALSPGPSEERCMATSGLAVRLGAAATPVLKQVLTTSKLGVVRWCILIDLAGYGDDSAVPEALRLLKGWLRGPRLIHDFDPSRIIVACLYLSRHHGAQPRAWEAAADAVRSHWDDLDADEHDWFSEYLPQLHPDSKADVHDIDETKLNEYINGLVKGPGYSFDLLLNEEARGGRVR